MAPAKQALLGVKTQVVTFSDYDAIKQAYSRRGDPNSTVGAHRGVQGIIDDAELIVREAGQMPAAANGGVLARAGPSKKPDLMIRAKSLNSLVETGGIEPPTY